MAKLNINTMTSYFYSVMESQTSDEGTTSTVLGGGQHTDLSPMRTETRTKSPADVGQIKPENEQQCKYSLSALLYDVHNLFWSLYNFTINECRIIPIGTLTWKTFSPKIQILFLIVAGSNFHSVYHLETHAKT